MAHTSSLFSSATSGEVDHGVLPTSPKTGVGASVSDRHSEQAIAGLRTSISNGDWTPEVMLQQIAESARLLTQADGAAIALRQGDAWLAAQIEYLRANRDLLQRELPLPMVQVQATYLAWIDARAVKDPYELFLQYGVAVSPGEQFGAPGFIRLNFGTQRARLREALQRMRHALRSAG